MIVVPKELFIIKFLPFTVVDCKKRNLRKDYCKTSIKRHNELTEVVQNEKKNTLIAKLKEEEERKTQDIKNFVKEQGYNGEDIKIFLEAFTSCTCDIQKYAQYSNIMLEFLGDAVIGLVMTHYNSVKAIRKEKTSIDLELMTSMTSNEVMTKIAEGFPNLLDLVISCKSGKIRKRGYKNYETNEKKHLSDYLEALVGAFFVSMKYEFKLIKKLILKWWDFGDLPDPVKGSLSFKVFQKVGTVHSFFYL